MIALEVKKGTDGLVIKDGKEWVAPNFTNHTTTKDLLFFAEDIRIDPLGKVGCGPQDCVTIGGVYAAGGWYGFERDGWILLVPFAEVEAH